MLTLFAGGNSTSLDLSESSCCGWKIHKEKALNEPQIIRYRDTDLDVVCDFDPAILVEELDAGVNVAHVHHGDDGLHYILCEDVSNTKPEFNIVRLLDVVDKLSESAKNIWNRCSKREFNIGYDCGNEPREFNQHISNPTLRRIVDCGGALRITLYPIRPAANSETSECPT